MKINKPKRCFVKNNLIIKNWDSLKPYFTDILNRRINSLKDLKKWLKDNSELEAIIEEDLAWRYIKMTIDTKNESLNKKFNFFVTEIEPEIAPLSDKINRKLNSLELKKELNSNKAYNILFRKIRESLELYREENIEIISKVSSESQKYGALCANQEIEHNGNNLTLQQASLFLKEPDEKLRKIIFNKIAERRREDFIAFDNLFDSLRKKRHEIAINAGFKNFRDYKMKSLGRFDYTVDDCYNFHKSIKKVIVPIVKKIQKNKLSLLGKDKFMPWDTDVDPEGKSPLKPFKTGKELIQKSIKMFNDIDPFFGECLKTMKEINHLDLESKNGKSPGGYNYPLYETGIPFIFMNAVGSHRDLVTMIHEGGHAIHSFLSKDLELTEFKNLPSEVAELASMSMELISMEKWNQFYNIDDCNRAKKEQLETILKILPWIAQIDEFQHWVYVNHNHTSKERKNKWLSLCKEYGTGLIDWSKNEDILATSWQRQLHIFEVPFYYIEYGIAQLGAVSIWKNFIENNEKAIEQYKNALRLGYTKSIPEIYKEANVKFDFTINHITELSSFLEKELEKI